MSSLTSPFELTALYNVGKVVEMMSRLLEKVRGRSNARGGAIARKGGVSRVEGGGVEARVRGMGEQGVSREVYRAGEGIYETGGVVKVGSAVYRVGAGGRTVSGGLMGYEVRLDRGDYGVCGCRGFVRGGRVCRHLIAAALSWTEEQTFTGQARKFGDAVRDLGEALSRELLNTKAGTHNG